MTHHVGDFDVSTATVVDDPSDSENTTANDDEAVDEPSEEDGFPALLSS